LFGTFGEVKPPQVTQNSTALTLSRTAQLPPALSLSGIHVLPTLYHMVVVPLW
jgi:hypothetical protein